MSPLMKDLNRRLAGKKRPDSLKDVELSLAGPPMTKSQAEAELGRINDALAKAKSGLFTANAKCTRLKLPVAKTVAAALKAVEKCIAEMGNYEAGKILSLADEHPRRPAR
jgi:hypothetical protein